VIAMPKIKRAVERVQVEMHPDLKKRLVQASKDTMRSMNGYAVYAIRKQVELDENRNRSN
jgi:hypothetical protein